MNITWGLLSKYKNELYGFSILWIMLFHGIITKNIALPKSINFLKKFLIYGNIGVEVFLFLSGICLYFSLKKNDNIVNFYWKRIIRVFIPFLIIDGLWWAYSYIYEQNNLLKFIENITFYSFWVTHDQTVWFIALIIPLYFVYPYIYKFLLDKENCLIRICFFIVLSYVLCLTFSYLNQHMYRGIEIALTRIPIFLLGCYCGVLVFENRKISKTVLIISIISFIFGVFLLQNYSLIKSFRIQYLFIGPSVVIWLTILLEYCNSERINSQLSLWGGLSLELYLSHVIFRIVFMQSKYFTSNKIANFSEYIILCIFGALIVSYCVAAISDYLNRYLLQNNIKC